MSSTSIEPKTLPCIGHCSSVCRGADLESEGSMDRSQHRHAGRDARRVETLDDRSQPGFPAYHRRFANPAPLGLLGFGATTFVLSMYQAQARGVTHTNAVLGMCLIYGGTAQILVGLLEWAAGNTFGTATSTSYGCFWISYACLLIPQFQIREAYSSEAEYASAITIFNAAWFIVTFIFLLASLRTSIALAALFFFLDITYLLLMIGSATAEVLITQVGGGFGILTASIALYIAASGLLNDTSFFRLPIGDWTKKKDV